MVLDTGGQYWGATTDITRTIYLGDNPKNEIKNRYTRVLQGNMHLANGVFPNNTPGRDRQNWIVMKLWDRIVFSGYSRYFDVSLSDTIRLIFMALAIRYDPIWIIFIAYFLCSGRYRYDLIKIGLQKSICVKIEQYRKIDRYRELQYKTKNDILTKWNFEIISFGEN